MAISKTRFRKGVTVVPDTDALEGIEGEIKVDSADGKLKATLGGSARELLTNSQSATLTNKTFDADGTGNSITNIENADIKAGAAIDASKIADGSVSSTEFQYINSLTSNAQTQINTVSSAAGTAQTDINNHIADAVDAHDASAISNIPSGNLAATEVQAALNELQTDVDTRALASDLTNHINDAVDAHDASAISNIPSGNLAATEVQAALNELQTDVDTRALNSDLTTHTGASTGVHGVTGSVVGTSDSQVLTNKTITGADFRTPVRSDVKQDIKANLTTYALTASNGQLVFATDTKEMFQVVDTLLVAVGSGGVGNVDALLTQTFDTAALPQFTQTGLALTTSNPIDGTISAQLIHQAASSQSFKQVIAVDRKYRGDLMALSLQVRSSATSGNLTLLVTDETNSAVIMASSSISTGQYQVTTAVTNATTTISGFSNVDINSLKVGMTVTGSGIPTATVISSINTAANTIVISQAATASATITAKFSALPDRKSFSFTIPTNCASLSYTVTALQEAGLPESYIDDVVIELANVSLLETSFESANITAWQGYTPTFTGFGTPSAVEFEWRQVGENVEIRGKFTSGTTTAVEARVGLPAGLTSAGTGLIPSIQAIGAYFIGVTTANDGGSVLVSPSTNYINISSPAVFNSGTVNALSPALGSSIGTSDIVSFFASIPCAGLSATSTKTIALTQSGLVQEADSNLQINGFTPAKGSTNTAIVTISSGSIAKNIGNHIVWSSSATLGDTFTATKSGVYSFSFSSDLGSASDRIGFSKNSSQLTTAVTAINSFDRLLTGIDVGSTGTINCAWTGLLVIGDIVRLHSSTTAFTAASVSDSTFSCSYQGSLKQVTVNTNSKITIPTSELRFEGASSRGAVATAIVKFDTLAKIRGDAFTVTNTSNDGTFVTMLKAGRLNVGSNLFVAANYAYLTRNKSVLTTAPGLASENLSASGAGAGSVYTHIAWEGDVIVGDVIRVSSAGNPTADSINNLTLSFQEQDIQVSVTNILPTFSESDSSVRVDTANGYGSTGTAIRRFSNIRDNIGTDIEYSDSATNGASFTAKTSGLYNISYTDAANSTSNAFFGISKNASSLTTLITSLAATERLSLEYLDTAQGSVNCAVEVYLNAGDVIRPHTNNPGAYSSPERSSFTMSKVGKPNVTGVNVTPFVNVPQIDRQSTYAQISAPFTSTVTGALTSSNGSGIYSYNSSTGIYTMLKSAKVDITYTAQATATNLIQLQIVVTSLGSVSISANDAASGTSWATASYSGILQSGETFSVVCNPSGSVHRITVVAEALSDQILTVPETFSTDTAALQYAGSGVYTLATLANAPVGTYITFTYAASTNTRTQTTTRPTQTDADMNANGMLIYTRVFTAASTAAQPSTIALQIGKGLKGISRGTYKSAGKVTSGNLDFFLDGSTQQRGALVNSYNEVTGILIVDLGAVSNGTISNSQLYFDDVSSTTNGYLVINASKNVSLIGMNIERVSASGRNSSGQSIPSNTATTMVYDATKRFDTNGALNAATGIFTCPETGYYQVSAGATFNALTPTSVNNVFTIQLYKNGTASTVLGYLFVETVASAGRAVRGAEIISLNKGDTLSLSVFHNTTGAKTLTTAVEENYFSITKTNIGGKS